jgi:hypothetical protein
MSSHRVLEDSALGRVVVHLNARDIRPLTPDDLPELSRFLAAGFGAPPGADFAAPEVLRWKYLEPVTTISIGPGASGDQRETGNPRDGADDDDHNFAPPRSYIACDQGGRIVGHLGLCRTFFEGQMISAAGRRVATMHIIDWLGSSNQRSIGISLMRQSHQGVATQFGLGVSPSALAVGERAGYELRGLVPVYNRVLRAGYWLRTVGPSPLKRGLRLARDLADRLMRIPAAPRAILVLERVPEFGSEISSIVAKAKAHVILTRRDPARLNAFLRFPRQTFSGWHLRDHAGGLRGFAVLNLVPQDDGRTRTGKIVDCLIDDVDVPLWQAAILALTRELAQQGADMAQVYASTPWMSEASGRCGFISRYGAKFHIRDPLGLIPHGATFHLTTLEGDYGYT